VENFSFDMHYFSARRGINMGKFLKQLDDILKKKKDEIPQHANFIEAVRKGIIEADVFKKFGPTMALQWVSRLEDVARDRQEQTDLAKKMKEDHLDRKKAERAMVAARVVQEDIDAGEEVEMADEENFDPFSDDLHPGMWSVKWKQPWGTLAKLLEPMDPAVPEPRKVTDKYRPKPDESQYWISVPQILDNFKFDPTTKEPAEGMGTLTALMDHRFNLH
jgi:hypothetical protein